MHKAIWNGEVIAESTKVKKVEGNTYFPKNDVNEKYLKKSATHYVCPWKGTANFFNIDVDGKINWNGAWSYPEPKTDAKNIKEHIAFARGVKVTEA